MGFMDTVRSKVGSKKKEKTPESDYSITQARLDRAASDAQEDKEEAIAQKRSRGANDMGMRAVIGEDTFTRVGETDARPTQTKQHRVKAKYNFDDLDAAAAKILEERDDDEEVIDFSSLSKKERKALEDAMGDTMNIYPHLMALKPREKYMFRSDYFHVDGQVATILSYFNDDSAMETLPPFWGINRIPNGLPKQVTAVILEQVSRESDSWVDDKLATTDKVDKLEEREDADGGSTMSDKRRRSRIAGMMNEIAAELLDGDAYLRVHNRLMLKAPSLDVLDDAIERVRRTYVDLFTSLNVEAWPGEQLKELSTMLSFNKDKRGKGFHFTSRQYAGSYSLVTNGLNDPRGEYVGQMVGDVNNSAVLFDVNGYRDHVVCADETQNRALGRVRQVDMWGSKIAQSALTHNHRVVHLVLNGTDLDSIGPKLEGMTSRVDMSGGEVNMFEVFGDVEDEVSLFSVHLQKLVLMTQQLYGKTDQNQAIIAGKLREILTDFYVEQDMWSKDAKNNRERLRLVGIPHEEVPLLQVFVTYLEEAYRLESHGDSNDSELISALSALSLIFRNELDSNGDLFNQHTDKSIDRVNDSRRVIYEFSSLLRRGGGTDGRGVAMAQLLNIVGFAVESLTEGDVVIIHGAESITDPAVQQYLAMQFEYLKSRGGRVVYLYGSVDSMLENWTFNRFNRADYTVLGPMDGDTLLAYKDVLNEAIPPELEGLVREKDANLSYLRRGVANIVFQTDLPLGMRDADYFRDNFGGGVSAKERNVGWSTRFGRIKSKSGTTPKMKKSDAKIVDTGQTTESRKEEAAERKAAASDKSNTAHSRVHQAGSRAGSPSSSGQNGSEPVNSTGDNQFKAKPVGACH